MKIEVEVTGCHDCPYLKAKKVPLSSFMDDVYYCEKGAFGNYSMFDKEEYYNIPKIPPVGCPYFEKLDLVIQDIGCSFLTKEKLKEILDKYNLKIIDK